VRDDLKRSASGDQPDGRFDQRMEPSRDSFGRFDAQLIALFRA